MKILKTWLKSLIIERKYNTLYKHPQYDRTLKFKWTKMKIIATLVRIFCCKKQITSRWIWFKASLFLIWSTPCQSNRFNTVFYKLCRRKIFVLKLKVVVVVVVIAVVFIRVNNSFRLSVFSAEDCPEFADWFDEPDQRKAENRKIQNQFGTQVFKRVEQGSQTQNYTRAALRRKISPRTAD